VDEMQCAGRAAVASEPRWDELGVGINGNPRPSVADSIVTLQSLWNVRLFAIGEAPNLVNLYGFAREVNHHLVVVFGARFADIYHHSRHAFA